MRYKVGDRVYFIEYNRFGNNKMSGFGTVARYKLFSELCWITNAQFDILPIGARPGARSVTTGTIYKKSIVRKIN